MRQTIAVSKRGQISLPANLRKRLGIQPGGVVTIEAREGALIVRPAAGVDIDLYSDNEISQWDHEDTLDEAGRHALLQRLAAGHL